MAETTRMRMGELEKASGMARTTIHYYTREGLLNPPHKTGKTMGYYDEGHLKRLKDIQAIQLHYHRLTGKPRMPIALLKQRLREEGVSGGGEPSSPSTTRKRGLALREKRRGEIKEAALQLYSERGYYQTSVRDIAHEAGISPATFYLYFPDKRELFVELFEDVIEKFMKDTAGAVDAEENPFGKAIIMIRAFHDNYAVIGEIVNQLRAGVAVNDNWAKEKYRKVIGELNQRSSELLRQAMTDGYIREVDPDILAYIMTVVAEASFQRASVDDKYTYEQIAFLFVDWIYNGLDPRLERESQQGFAPPANT